MFFSLLLVVATQAVPDGVNERIRVGIEKTEVEYQHVETERLPRGAVVLKWKMRNPPELDRNLPERERASRQSVRVVVVDCIDAVNATKYFKEVLAEAGKDAVVKDLGDEAVRRGGGNSETTISVRIRKNFVDINAPSEAVAMRFARAALAALGEGD